MIPRYTRIEMGRVWSETNRFQRWLDVEFAAAETLAEAGMVPQDAATLLRSRAKVDVARINELEARVKHDVIAFTMAVGESIKSPSAARWLHYGMTSNDVVDTAQALLLRDASHIIERDLICSVKCWICAPMNFSTHPKSAAPTAFTRSPSPLG